MGTLDASESLRDRFTTSGQRRAIAPLRGGTQGVLLWSDFQARVLQYLASHRNFSVLITRGLKEHHHDVHLGSISNIDEWVDTREETERVAIRGGRRQRNQGRERRHRQGGGMSPRNENNHKRNKKVGAWWM